MFDDIKNIYFIGIGGIGMSALARYFKAAGCNVGGYDKTPSDLTNQLSKEGIFVTYDDKVEAIPSEYCNPECTLVVYTPAVSTEHPHFAYFVEHNMQPRKRSWVLGMLSRKGKALCVAGTHGKTTTTGMLAWLLHNSHVGCSAFLGGISTNFGTNLVIDHKSPYIVIEADEFDRSFLQLTPYISGITATDNDHLDIYGTREALLEAFSQFTRQTEQGGKVFIREGLNFGAENVAGTYGVNAVSNYRAENVRSDNGHSLFDYYGACGNIFNLELSVPGQMNVENAILAITIALEVGVTEEEIRRALPLFSGTLRRFNIHARGKVTYIDDYAHHPQEIAVVLDAIRANWAGQKLTVAFQPHLYTRTRDLCEGFIESLNMADEVILLDIYPAREKPIPGITSDIILRGLKVPSRIVAKEDFFNFVVSNVQEGIFVTMGAGDIDRFIPQIKRYFVDTK